MTGIEVFVENQETDESDHEEQQYSHAAKVTEEEAAAEALENSRSVKAEEADDQATGSKKKKLKQGDEVIEILSSSSEEEQEEDEPIWDSDDWEGPAEEDYDEVLHAVIRACPYGRGHRTSVHSKSHVKVIAVFRTKERAERRAEGIRARLDEGGHADGMIPGGTGYEDLVDVWVQEVRCIRKL